MAAINDEVKRFIVQALARYDGVTEVVRQVKEEYGIVVTKQQVSAYHPERYVARALSEKWKVIFAETRKSFLEKVGDIPIANQAVRLHKLSQLIDTAMSRGNASLAAQLIEQASKEIGGAFTNRREMTGKNGAPLIPQKSAQEMTDDELAAYIAASGGRTLDPSQG